MIRVCTLFLLLATMTACTREDRIAAGYAMRNYGYHRQSTTVYCTTTYSKRSSMTSCF
jgi:hypothetical protein